MNSDHTSSKLKPENVIEGNDVNNLLILNTFDNMMPPKVQPLVHAVGCGMQATHGIATVMYGGYFSTRAATVTMKTC